MRAARRLPSPPRLLSLARTSPAVGRDPRSYSAPRTRGLILFALEREPSMIWKSRNRPSPNASRNIVSTRRTYLSCMKGKYRPDDHRSDCANQQKVEDTGEDIVVTITEPPSFCRPDEHQMSPCSPGMLPFERRSRISISPWKLKRVPDRRMVAFQMAIHQCHHCITKHAANK